MRTDSFYRCLCRLSTLRSAWLHVAESDGCAGVDGVTISAFAHNLEAELTRLSSELSNEIYKPLPLLRFFITKANGGQRPLSVPTVRDRIAQTGLVSIIEPVLEKEFETCSFAYRKGHSVKQALQQIDYLHQSGYSWVLDADITSYFENVDHELLLARLSEVIGSRRVLDLIRDWISMKIYDGHKLSENTKGLPQGSPLSPLLANLYLDTFDDQMLASGQKLVRFADDFVVLCKSKPKAENALKLTRQLLSNLRLTLNDKKTRITSFSDGFKYLGATFFGDLALVPDRSSRPISPALEIFLPPPLPVLRASSRRIQPFNPAIRKALLEAFDNVAPTEIPSFFQRPHKVEAITRDPDEESCDPETAIDRTEPAATMGAFRGNRPPTPVGKTKMPPPAIRTLRTLYIHEHGAIIRCEDEHLRIIKDEIEMLSLPVFKIDQIMLFGNSQVTTSAMKLCLRNNIPIIVLSGTGRYFGAIESTNNQNVLLHQKQFERLGDAAFVMDTARQIVSGKIWNSRALLQRRQRKTPSDRVAKSINELLTLSGQLNSATNLDQVRGYEGAAAASYFAAYGSCVPAAFSFKGRTRQPPLDPVNALLSFGYTLLFYNIFAIILSRGLSPYVGNLHSLRQGHPALCSDFIEELRAPIVDSLVTTLLNKSIFTPADFYFNDYEAMPPSNDTGQSNLEKESTEAESSLVGTSGVITVARGCFLTDAARRRFVSHFERRMNRTVLHPIAQIRTTWRGSIDIQVGHFVQLLRGEVKAYLPIQIR